MPRFIQIGFLALFGPVNARENNPISCDAGVFQLRRAEFQEWLRASTKSIDHSAFQTFFLTKR